LVICKPDAVERGLVGEIIGRIERKGLRLVAAEMRTITVEVADAHYAEHRGEPFFDTLVTFITRSPVLLMVVEGPEDTYRVVRNMMGATNPGCGSRNHPGRSGPGHGEKTEECIADARQEFLTSRP
jgi:nucleoside-diphosphate kinase